MRKRNGGCSDSSRRKFLEGAAGGVIAALGGGKAATLAEPGRLSFQPPRTPASKKFIGIQIGAVSFVDEGVPEVLDTLQERAAVNALMLAVFTYGRGIAGRQIPGQPLPDHGKQSYDTETFHGGSYAAVHPEYYRNTIFKNFRAPDLGDFDVLGSVVPEARKRGIESYCWLEDVYNPKYLANFDEVAEVDVEGRPTGEACLNHPEIRHFLKSLVTDYVKSYPVDGVMWGSERQGPLSNAIGAHHGGFNGRASITCFCEFCRRKGEERGISVERARRGFQEIRQFARAAWSGERTSDGYFVAFWRLLVNYPELLAWEKLWTDNQQEVYGEIYGTIKAVDLRLKVGWHIWHNNSFSPFYRAEQDYGKFRPVSDFLKVVMYNNCGGPRLAEYIRNIHSTIFRDTPPEVVLALHYDLLGYRGEASLDKLPTAGLSADYVARETKRALAGVEDQIAIYPGIDIDIPTGKTEKKTQPSDVRAAVRAALEAGAPGVILSRKYSEMNLANLSAVSEALRS